MGVFCKEGLLANRPFGGKGSRAATNLIRPRKAPRRRLALLTAELARSGGLAMRHYLGVSRSRYPGAPPQAGF